MTDRFKFRAWDTVACRYEYEIQYSLFDYYIDDDRYVIEQCTGLKDKNGKWIYEGDILKFAINDPEEDYFYGEVRYSSENWKYELVSGNETFCLCQVQEHDIEVIGNVHEDIKALEGKK